MSCLGRLATLPSRDVTARNDASSTTTWKEHALSTVRLDKRAHSAAVFCQAACNYVFGADLVIDGAWGPKTQEAMDESQRRTGVGGDMSAGPDSWRQWLHEVARAALRGEAYWAFEADAAR